ncbi:uncharacterized protein EURHEDRAFT_487208 [Aspergillus ruber CBS 135680]|uniref:ER-bound oxygenase mpaB/mpaB'/Rubber oxygenase catalytic domain-containing protein n=1 Tax=Aspergillus ruber (strain CBS 135680) TaxID=1388766 RepID=A0A017S3R7_ASPRC|nr:uncharacterized protein EURHEDRAFT_487208 [Aspergillus ruber CBS 135680]EYE91279.1 hypothetical protein EURHEDRAFT_487208 [Aspergillus ruber CBS 135680]
MPTNIMSYALSKAGESISAQQRFLYALLGLCIYLALVSLLRFRRCRKLHRAYPYRTREEMSKMTDQDAWAIQKQIMQGEFPFMMLKALQFALFRTYGIPTISNLLLKTSQFSDSATSFKRYADTGTLIGEFIAFEPHSDRAQTAIARTKYLHKGYRASGMILESDMLYTLSLFATEPIRFVKLYEWREMTDMERCAVGTYWKSLGDALGINYDTLPSGRTGFRDGINWLEEISAWEQQYEVEHMKPHVRNKEIADKTIDVLLYYIPSFMKPLGVNLISYLMDDRLRIAMMYPVPPALSAVFATVFQLRQFYLRYLALPRPDWNRLNAFTDAPNKHGRHFLLQLQGAPYYVRPTIWNRWAPMAWVKWSLGQPLPGDEGKKYFPQGYYTPDLGPKYFEGKGRKEMEAIKLSLQESRQGQCPFP